MLPQEKRLLHGRSPGSPHHVDQTFRLTALRSATFVQLTPYVRMAR